MSDIFSLKTVPFTAELGMALKNFRIENKVTAKKSFSLPLSAIIYLGCHIGYKKRSPPRNYNSLGRASSTKENRNNTSKLQMSVYSYILCNLDWYNN